MSEEIKTNGTSNQTNKRNPIVIIAAVAVIVLALAVGMGVYNSPSNKLARLIDLGQKYLTEEDYGQAVLAFREAIEIDPKCEQAYLGVADAYIGLGNLDAAHEILAQASELMETTQITEKMEYIASLREEQLKAESVKKTEELEEKEKTESKVEIEETQTAESETSAETTAVETMTEAVSTEQASTEETTSVETSTAPVDEEKPHPALETGGTWIDEVYNNLVTGNYAPLVEMLKNREMLESTCNPYQTYLGGGKDEEGNEIGILKYRLTTSSGKSVYFESRYGRALVESAEITGYNLSFYYVDGQGGSTYDWYNSIGYGCYMVSYSYDTGKYEWLVGNAMYDSQGKAQILQEDEYFKIW